MDINIVMLDCQKMFVEGVTGFLDKRKGAYRISAQVCTAQDLWATMEIREFQYLVLDLNIPDQDGIEVIAEVRKMKPDLKIVVVSAYSDFKLVRDAMVNGADGYVSKTSTLSELVYALDEVSTGNTYIGDGLRTSPAASSTSRKTHSFHTTYQDTFVLKNKLTPRESEVLELLTQGLKSRGIADKLFISDQTVGVHRKNIMKKLGVRSTASLIKFALENHLV